VGALLLAVTAACLGSFGAFVAASLRAISFLRFCLAAYVVAWAGLVAVTVTLSILGWLSRETLGLGVLVLAAMGPVVWSSRGWPPTPPLKAAVHEAFDDRIVRYLALVVLAGGMYLGAVAFLTLPNDWDGLTYHETRALLWDQQGSVGYVPAGNDPRLNGNPPVSEIAVYAAMLVPRSERFAAFPQYAAFWASIAAVILAARRFGLSRPEATYGGLVFATLPIVLLHGAAILNDLVVASFLLAAIVFLLDERRSHLALGSLALGLALSTKFTAVLALPLVVAIVLAGAASGRRRASAIACGAGVVLGSPWYLVNLVETGSLDGDIADSTNQTAGHSLGALIVSLRAFSFDVVDISGLWRSEIYVVVAVGILLGGIGLLLLLRGSRFAPTLVGAALVSIGIPLLLRWSEPPVRYLWEQGWLKLDREAIAVAHPDAWKVLSVPDTSLSWFGAAGAVVIIGGVVTTLIAVRRREMPGTALLCALAPSILVATFVLTITYDPWRGRLLISGVGLACAAWGWTLRVRWLSLGVATLCCVTLVLSLVHSFTKPFGTGVLEPRISPSIWGRDRIDALTVVRHYEGTPALLREVEKRVPATAKLAVAMPGDSFLAPLAGPDLSRILRLVEDGARVPTEADWLVSRAPASSTGCLDSWAAVYSDATNDVRLLRRVRPDQCGSNVAPI
jgi:hypothetical protein